MGKRIAGTCYIKVDGQQLELEGSLEFPLSQVVRESKVASGRVVGFGETKVVPYISGNFFVPSDFPLEKLLSSEDMTVTAECANGMVYTLSGAFMSDQANFNPIDGTTTIKFDGEEGRIA